MASNISTITTTPYNLTGLGESDTLAEMAFYVNQAGNGLPMISILIIIYIFSFYYLNRQEYDVPSCIAYSSYVTFVIALMGRIIEFSGSPLINTDIVLFFGILSAVATFILMFTSN